jgi:inner membrane protein
MKINGWGKWVGLAAVLLLLTIGLGQVSEVVEQRQDQRQAAVRSVAQSLAGSQTLLGPLAQMACVEEWPIKADGESKAERTGRREFTRVAAPTSLTVDGTTQLESRARGLHATQVFHLRSTLSAQWADLSALKAERTHPDSRMQCGPAQLALAVSDARGIRHLELKVNGAVQPVQAGTFLGAYPRGVHATLAAGTDLAAPMTAVVSLELMGTEQLGIVPIGTATQVHISSNWPHPSFGGQFLPLERQIGDNGFDARWRVSALASAAQQDVVRQRPLCNAAGPAEPARASGEAATAGNTCVESLDVTFIDPTNTYALSNRATKYGFLFIALTFVAVGLFELMRSLRVHPIQYFLVGAAISIFFLLLVSLSEHLSFAAAYAIAATACVLLLAYYASHMLKSWKRGLPFGLGVATLYGLLFVLLQMEQKALVVGAIALFLVLATVMALTRKVDWYARLQLDGRPRVAPDPS